MFINILGIIGSGKSTLVSNLAARNKYAFFMEPVETNPFLEIYYKDPVRWSYAMQVNLLFERFKQSQEAYLKSLNNETVVMDSSLYSDFAFCLVQKWSHYFTDAEYHSYLNMHKFMATQVAYPDMVIWLDLPIDGCIERIKKRSRDCEAGIPKEYLESLHRAYMQVFDKLKKHTGIISVDASADADSVYNTVNSIINKYRDDEKHDELKYM